MTCQRMLRGAHAARALAAGWALAAALGLLACSDGKGTSCPSGQADCAGACRNLGADPLHCGACFFRCLQGGICSAGMCGCPPSLPDACATSDACVNLRTGEGGSCGSCGLVCQGAGVAATDATCSGGTCACTGAATGCGGNPACVDLQSDEASCGACGTRCALAREECTGGRCGCPSTHPTRCATACVDTAVDAANCGGCDRACAVAGQTCSGGACACPAQAPTACGGRCVSTLTSADHCGGCDRACTVTGQTCSGGACACPASAPTACGGRCVSTLTSADHCGACGRACGAGSTCLGGSCCGLACGGACCTAGTACCPGSSCPISHSNGLGQSYASCDPLGTYTRSAAVAAAAAWSAAGTVIDGLCDPSCLAKQTGSACAVWCYSGSSEAGNVGVRTTDPQCALACPYLQSPKVTWN